MIDWINKELEQLRNTHSYRTRRRLDSAQGTHIVVDGKSYLSFCSNDYLGLANDSRVTAALQAGIRRYGLGSGASPLVTGYSRAHGELEESLADFLKCQRVILFSSGYMASLGLISALFDRHSRLFEDRLNHASLIDAAHYAGARLQRYRHRDLQHLSSLLELSSSGTKCGVMSDGIFSMEGTIAPVGELCHLSQQFGLPLIIDDAHALGVLGQRGAGTMDHFQRSMSETTAVVGTFGKAFGTSGAFVATSHQLAEWLIQKARTLIYSTAQPPAIACATRKSLDIIQSEPGLREKLYENIQHFRKHAENLNLRLTDSITPIQAVILGGNSAALEAAQKLDQQGIFVTPIRPPTVPNNTARLRITLSAAHSRNDVDRLLDALGRLQINTDQLQVV